MDRLIIKSIEGRIMLGITSFIAIMILIGWVAINEQGRMAEFVEQHEGRSIERGAELFASNCSTCHGINGYGSNRAPGLNSPHLFGYDYLAVVNDEIASLQRELADLNGITGVTGINDQIGTQELLENRRDDIIAQIAEMSDEESRDLRAELLNIEARLTDNSELVAERIAAIESEEFTGDDLEPALTSSELDAYLLALQENIPIRIAENEALLNGEEGLLAQRAILLEDLSGAILRGYLPEIEAITAQAEAENHPLLLTNYLATDANRLAQIEFGGAIDGYLTTTLIHGRPGSGTVWDGSVMSSWSQRAGGPLRDDQIGDLVAYISNWNLGDNWTIDSFNAVQQYAKIHTAYTGEPGETVPTVGTNVDEILANLPAGDATRGEALYSNQEALEAGGLAGCASCHLNGVVGPDTVGTWTRVENQRLTLPEFADYTAEQYLIESIVRPNDYIVPSYSSGVMTANYGAQLTAQDLADIIAYLETQTQ